MNESQKPFSFTRVAQADAQKANASHSFFMKRTCSDASCDAAWGWLGAVLGGKVWLAGLVLALGICPGRAQWLTQTNVIVPGWSAVYLYVDASSQTNLIPGTPGLPLGYGNPIDQVWMWKYPSSTAQYFNNPLSPLSGGGQWLTWQLNATNAANTLATLIPNAAYLVHSSAATNYVWTVKGQPAVSSYAWDITGLNFIGFPTPYVDPPSFQNYFAQNPAVASVAQYFAYSGGPFSILNPQQVFSPSLTPVTRGHAYWVSAVNVNNTYFGPFKVTLPTASGITFGATVGQQTIRLINVTTNTLTVFAQLMASETPPTGQTSIVGPPPLLLQGALNSSNLTYAYTSMGLGVTNSWTLPPYGTSGCDIPVVIGVNRYDLAAAAGSLYAGFLRFTDSLGFSEVEVPVSAVSANNAGLWVGSASISQVGSYLKSYATNLDGTYAFSTTTNNQYATVPSPPLVTSNYFLVTQSLTNTTLTYAGTNQLSVNSYTAFAQQLTTNAFVLSTNLMVTESITTNAIVQTNIAGFYLTNSGLVLITTNAYSTQVTVTARSSPVVVTVTNAMAVASNGLAVTVSNLNITNFYTISQRTTIDIYAAAVTNLVGTRDYATTNTVNVSSRVQVVVVTNLLALTNYSAASYSPLTFSPATYATTNVTVLTNFAFAMTGALRVATQILTNLTPPVTNWIAYNVITNINFGTNYFQSQSVTNTLAVTNNYAIIAGLTNWLSAASNWLTTYSAAQPVVTPNNTTNLLLFTATYPAYTVILTNATVTTNTSYLISGLDTNLGAVPTPFPLRLIVFNDGATVTLMQRVYYGLRQETNLVVATTERVLDASHLGSARRISCTSLPWTPDNTLYPFSGKLVMGGTLSTTVTDAYDDQAANPFLHTFHPDHNNLDLTQNPPRELPPGSQSFSLTRVITLTVAPNTADFLTLTTANSALAGYYQETTTLTGLAGASRTFTSAGGFALKRISPIATLTTQ